MIKLLIVDDEIFVRIGLATVTAWKEQGFELVGEAENGQIALDQCRRLLPDIVLVDIKMVGMDGLEFIEKAKIEFPGMRFIVLSGYNDFQYTQRAIRIGVNDFIMKNTVQPQELVEIVKKVAEGLTPNNLEKISEERDNIKALFLGNVASSFVCNLNTPLWTIAMEVINKETFLQNFKGAALDRMLIGIVRLANEVFTTNSRGYVVRLSDSSFAAVVCAEIGRTIAYQDIEELALRIISILKKYLSVEIAIGIGGVANTFDETKRVWMEAQMALNLRFYKNEKPIVLHLRHEEADKELIIVMNARQQMSDLTNAGRIEEAFGIFKAMLDSVATSATLDPQKLKVLCVGFFEEIYLHLYRIKVIDELIMIKLTNCLIDCIFNCQGIDEMISSIDNEMYNITSIYINEGSINRETIQQLCRYIELNISSHLSLANLSQRARMSEGHLSRVFRQATGKSIQEFIQNTRMDRARELAATRLSFEEIALRCGFENPSSFSRAFRQNTGETFRDYRARHNHQKQTQSLEVKSI